MQDCFILKTAKNRREPEARGPGWMCVQASPELLLQAGPWQGLQSRAARGWWEQGGDGNVGTGRRGRGGLGRGAGEEKREEERG